jgi:hypothetical protein
MGLQVGSYPHAGLQQEIDGGNVEFYTFVNIFETKGLEYLLLMCFFALFIFLVRYLSGSRKNNSAPGEKHTKNPGQKAVAVNTAHR